MSREYLDQTYVLKNQNKQEEFDVLFYQWQSDYEFFQIRLKKLREILAVAQGMPAQKAAYNDCQTTQNLLSTFQAYLEKLKTTRTLGFATNKIDDEDDNIFTAQAKSVHALRLMVETPANNIQSAAPTNSQSTTASNDTQSATSENTSESSAPANTAPRSAANTTPSQPAQSSPDALSQLIDDAKNMAYDVSYKTVWLRRVASVIAGLVAFAAVSVVMVAFMTPGINVLTAILSIPIALGAMLAFWNIIKPETTAINTHATVGPTTVPTSFTMPVPSTMGMIFSGLWGIFAVRKLQIMNPPREVAARDSQTATINQLTDLLKKKIEALQEGEVKTFLSSVVDKADRMYKEGATAWFYETRTAKTKKAHLILRETAKIMEGGCNNLIVDNILQTKINQTDYTFADLLNAQRNRFWQNKSSATLDALGQKAEQAKSLHIDNFAQAITVR